jgi:long-chain fatty acid transport protein
MDCSFKRSLATTAVAAALLAAPAAHATNGYFKIGYGSHNRGMAGAGYAFTQDSMSGVTNPAGMLDVGRRMDGGVELFNPQRDASLDATGLGGASVSEDSGATVFAIPHFGVAQPLTDRLSFGITAAANGGLNTRYNNNIYAGAFGPAVGATPTISALTGVPAGGFGAALDGFGLNVPDGFNDPIPGDPFGFGAVDHALFDIGTDGDVTNTLGVNLAQMIIAPTLAYRLTENHSIGVSLQLAYQTFRAYGLGLFKGFSSDPGNVTNNGNEESFGAGLRLGYQGRLTDWLTVGIAGATKTYMTEFDDYSGLFAEDGDFDIPANYGVGIALHPTEKLTLAVDAQRILYSDVKSINNDGPTGQEFVDAFLAVLTNGGSGTTVAKPLGKNDGWGFGWDDIWVFKAGLNYDYNSRWSLRAGVNHGENPIDDDQNLFNILAPGVVETHITAGFSYRPARSSEWTVTFMRALREDQDYRYKASTPLGDVFYDTEIGMDQYALEVQYSYIWE